MLSADAVRIVFLVAIFGSIVVIASLALRSIWDNRSFANSVNKRMKMIGTGSSRERVVETLRKNNPNDRVINLGPFEPLLKGFRRQLMMAAIPFTALQVCLAMALLFAGVLTLIFLSGTLLNYSIGIGSLELVIAFAAAVSIGLPVLFIVILAQRRRARMQEQFPVALDVFVRALRSGHPVSSALQLVTEEMEDPLGSEFGLVSDEVSYGRELTEALDDLAERWDMDDIRMFVVSLTIQNETGGNLAEILENLARIIRERASLYLKVRALSSEGRMTGFVLVVLPIITFVLVFTGNPDFYLGVADDPIVYIGFPILIVWYFIGIFIIWRMIDLKV